MVSNAGAQQFVTAAGKDRGTVRAPTKSGLPGISLDDPDRDGYSNMREQLMGTDPKSAGPPFRLDLSRWNQSLARLSWPSSSNFTYEIWGGTNVAAPSLITTVPGRFPETEWFTPYNAPSRNAIRQFRQLLVDGGLNVTVRDTRGREADAACGQLHERVMRQRVTA